MSRRATLLCLLLAGCASVETVPVPAAPEAGRAGILVLREWSAFAAGVPFAVGLGNRTHVALGTREYAEILVPPGSNQVFARLHSREASAHVRSLGPGERHCFRARVDYSFPPLEPVSAPIQLGSHARLSLNETACPSKEELARYTRVEVEYR
jgi:hypothetical protein